MVAITRHPTHSVRHLVYKTPPLEFPEIRLSCHLYRSQSDQYQCLLLLLLFSTRVKSPWRILHGPRGILENPTATFGQPFSSEPLPM